MGQRKPDIVVQRFPINLFEAGASVPRCIVLEFLLQVRGVCGLKNPASAFFPVPLHFLILQEYSPAPPCCSMIDSHQRYTSWKPVPKYTGNAWIVQQSPWRLPMISESTSHQLYLWESCLKRQVHFTCWRRCCNRCRNKWICALVGRDFPKVRVSSDLHRGRKG